ncbi:hypothetical protein ACA910_017919 [Epithemia clementina (nom. ined.)]
MRHNGNEGLFFKAQEEKRNKKKDDDEYQGECYSFRTTFLSRFGSIAASRDGSNSYRHKENKQLQKRRRRGNPQRKSNRSNVSGWPSLVWFVSASSSSSSSSSARLTTTSSARKISSKLAFFRAQSGGATFSDTLDFNPFVDTSSNIGKLSNDPFWQQQQPKDNHNKLNYSPVFSGMAKHWKNLQSLRGGGGGGYANDKDTLSSSSSIPAQGRSTDHNGLVEHDSVSTSTTRTTKKRTLVLGVDGGTESLRVGCFDAQTGQLLLGQTFAVPYTTKHPHPGWAEQEPHDWYKCLCQAVQQALTALRRRQGPDDDWHVAALCLDTTCCSVVALDSNYEPLRPCLLWMDQRSAKQTHQMALLKEEPALFINGGNSSDSPRMISAEWLTPKALWLFQNEHEETWQQAAVVCEYQDYLNYRLTGRLVASACNAAVRWHWDARHAAVATENDHVIDDSSDTKSPYPGRPLSLYQSLGIPDLAQKLPQSCLAMGQVVGSLTRQAARDLGFLVADDDNVDAPESLPVVIQGGPDAFVGMIGLGCIGRKTNKSDQQEENVDHDATTTAALSVDISIDIKKNHVAQSSTKPQLCLITGSSHLHCMVVPAASTTTPSVGRSGMWGPYQDAPLPGLAFGEGGQSSTGSLLKWAHTKLFGSGDGDDDYTTATFLSYKELDDWAAEIPPGSDGLLALETFQGSRTPVTDPLARGALIGLTLSHTKGHIWRALMEGVCFGTRACLESLESAAGQPCEEIILAGGIAKSTLWLQLHADITNRPIRVFGPEHNAPLLGCAILASLGLGVHDSVETALKAMLPPSTIIVPNPDNVAIYNRIYQTVYAQMASTLRPLVHAIHQNVLVEKKQRQANKSERHPRGGVEVPEPSIVAGDVNGKDQPQAGDTLAPSHGVTISPSLLACDFGSIQAEIKRCLDAGATRLHVDVFDGVALKSPDAFSFGPAMVRSIAKTLQQSSLQQGSNESDHHRKASRGTDHGLHLQEKPSIDLHMCVHRPERFVEIIAEAVYGTPCRFIFQWEGLPKWGRLNKALYLARCIFENNMQCGISINPYTPVEEIFPLLQSGLISVVDVLAVEPGFGGQTFQSHVLSKVATLRRWKEEEWLSYFDIMVDGGVNAATASRIVQAGANVLVSGSFLFRHTAGIRAAMQEMKPNT